MIVTKEQMTIAMDIVRTGRLSDNSSPVVTAMMDLCDQVARGKAHCGKLQETYQFDAKIHSAAHMLQIIDYLEDR